MRVEECLKLAGPKNREVLQNLFSRFPPSIEVSCTSLPAGSYLVRQDSACQTVSVLLEGRARTIIHQSDSATHAFADFYAVEFFCEYEVLAGMERILADVRAQADCVVMTMAAGDYLRWMLGDPQMFLTRVRSIMQTLLLQTAQGRSSLYLGSTSRIKQFLADYYSRHENGAGDAVTVRQTRAAIGEEIGFSARTINRTVNALLREDLIGIYKGKITLTPAQYEAICRQLEAMNHTALPDHNPGGNPS